MSYVDKIKTGFEECRMLALSVQVLVGFQFQGVFQPRFSDLKYSWKAAQIAGLVILLAGLGGLITPATQHILVERLQATRRIEVILTRGLDLSVLTLAAAMGADIGIALSTAAGSYWGACVGAATFFIAIALWFGGAFLSRVQKGREERLVAACRDVEYAPIAKQIDQMLTEARTVLPGAQALLGFQLTVFFAESFGKLPASSKMIHVAALLLVALTILFLMTPAVYHRIVYAGEESWDALRVGSRMVVASTIPLSAALALDTYVVTDFALEAPIAAAWIASAVFTGLMTAWLILPWIASVRRNART